jgi:hypothetical protein
MEQRQQRQELKKRWEQQRREQQQQQQRQWEREQRQKEQEQERQRPKTMNDLPAEMIHEIFDRNPEAGLVLARTNKWFSEVLKDKIKKYRELIRECNSASVCYSNSFHDILAEEYKKARKHNSTVTGITYICYFQCLNCFRSFEYGFSTVYFLIRTMDEVHETGIVLCIRCVLKYHGEKINEIMRERESVNYNDLEHDGSDDSSDDSGSIDFEDYE